MSLQQNRKVSFSDINKSLSVTNGNTGIGTTAPSHTLDVNGGLRSTNFTTTNALITNATTTTLSVTTMTSANARVTTSLMAIGNSNTIGSIYTTGGNVGIGTNSPSFPLDVNGTIRSRTSINSANGISIENPNTGSSAYSIITLATDQANNFNIFKNSTTRTSDGGVNTVTIRNDGGAVRLMSNTGSGMLIDTSGNVTVYGALSKGSGTFDIQHPLHPNDKTKHLVHSFIEGPRCDLIYRGEVQLVNGTATINIDSDCVAEPGCEMTQGTFEALCANPHFFLQNPSSFSRLKGNIQGNILTIECEDQDSSDIVYWNIIAERKDNTVKEWNRTNENGYLITEYEKEDLHN